MPALAGQGATPTAVTADMFVLFRINLFVDNSPNMFLSGFDRIECRVDPLIVGVSPEIPLTAVVILVDAHERRAREIGHVTGHTSIRRLVVDPFERPAHIEIADLPGVPIGIKQDLEVAIIVSLEPLGTAPSHLPWT